MVLKRDFESVFGISCSGKQRSHGTAEAASPVSWGLPVLSLQKAPPKIPACVKRGVWSRGWCLCMKQSCCSGWQCSQSLSSLSPGLQLLAIQLAEVFTLCRHLGSISRSSFPFLQLLLQIGFFFNTEEFRAKCSEILCTCVSVAELPPWASPRALQAAQQTHTECHWLHPNVPSTTQC